MRYFIAVTDLYDDHTSYHDGGQHLPLAQQLAAEIRQDRIEEGFTDAERGLNYRRMMRFADEIVIAIEKCEALN